jgi:hypothetical protein
MYDSDLSLCTMSTSVRLALGKAAGISIRSSDDSWIVPVVRPGVNNKNPRYHDPPEGTRSSTRRPMSLRNTLLGQSTSATAA